MYSIKTPVYQAHQIREFEHLAEARFNISSQVMMSRAGKAACDFLVKRWPQAQKVAVFCGSGNNGGDGYVLASQGHERGLQVVIWQVGDPSRLAGEAQNAMLACQAAHIPMKAFSEMADIEHPDVIVDAICGIGLHETLRADTLSAIKKMERARVPIFSIDLPSGIDANTGQVLGGAAHATATMTFIGLKLGLLTGNGIAYSGELVMNDLQLPPELFSSIQPIAEKIHLSTYSHYLRPRPRDWHKGLSGHVLIVGGDLGFSGAPRMAAESALRVGAGLVSIATRVENAPLMNIACPEIMSHGISNVSDLTPLLEKADVLVIGPGLGQSDWSRAIWEVLCKEELPMVVDADGLNLLSKTTQLNNNWVLTPHPGEAARLLNDTVENVQHDRLAALQNISERYGGTCVLKGAGSLVLAQNSCPAICDKGNPGMASAGLGDVLSGVIGGFIAQGIPLGDAAKLGVCLHAMAGDLAAKEGERGMIAMDLMPYLRRLANYSNHST